MKSFFAEKAKENQTKGHLNAPQYKDEKPVPQISAKLEKPIDTRKELAQIAGVSHDTIAKVEKIEQKAAPELKKAIE